MAVYVYLVSAAVSDTAETSKIGFSRSLLWLHVVDSLWRRSVLTAFHKMTYMFSLTYQLLQHLSELKTDYSHDEERWLLHQLLHATMLHCAHIFSGTPSYKLRVSAAQHIKTTTNSYRLMFTVAEIILEVLQWLKWFYLGFRRGYMWNKTLK